MTAPTSAGWNPDPAGKHQYRWFDGYRWTGKVGDQGTESVDLDGLADMNSMLAPPAAAAPKKSKTWLKVTLAIMGVGVLFVGGCVVLVGVGANEVSKQLDKEQEAHAISPAVYKSISVGDRKSEVIATAGKEPENSQEFESESFMSDEPSKSSCIYYNKSGGSFGDVYQLCFDNNRLTSKNAY